jgi:putative ABC transport system permease protein
MNLKEAFAIPIRALRLRPLGLVLTALGIVIGVAMVTVLSGFVSRQDGDYETTFDSLAKSLSLYQSTPNAPQATGIQSISDSDVAALTHELDPALVSHVIPIAKGTAMVRNQGRQFRTGISGSTPDYLVYKGTPLKAGSMFTEEQYQDSARVALIGPTVVKALFNGDKNAALGSNIYIGRLTFRVIGLVGPNATGNGGSAVVAPMTTVRNDLLGGIRTVGEVGIVTTTVDAVDAASKQVSAILDQTHSPRKLNGLQEDFSVDTFQAGQSAVGTQLMDVLFWCAVGVAAVVLFVSLVGLTGVITVAAAERPESHSWPVLTASVQVAAVAGLIGVAVGIGLVLVGRGTLPDVAPQYGVPHISTPGIALAFGLSLLVGLLAGLYPAVRRSGRESGDSRSPFGANPGSVASPNPS